MGFYQVLPFQTRVDLGVMPMKGSAHFPDLELNHQIPLSVACRTPVIFWERLLFLCRRYNQHFLSPTDRAVSSLGFFLWLWSPNSSTYIIFCIIIIIVTLKILSPWCSLTIHSCKLLLLVGHLNYIQYPHTADVYKSLLVSQHWHIHM